MREVDSDALLGVAGSLKIQNPATVTRQVLFDDENLQQVWDAAKFSRFPQLTAGFSSTLTPGLGATSREEFTFSDLFAQPEYDALLASLNLTPQTADAWLVGLAVTSSQGGSNLAEVSAGIAVESPEVLRDPIEIFRAATADVQGSTPIVAAGTRFPVSNDLFGDTRGILPSRVPRTSQLGTEPSVIFHMVEAGGGGATGITWTWRVHFCLRDMPVWYLLANGS